MGDSIAYTVLEHYSAPPPRLYAGSLPFAEQDSCGLINGRLSELAFYVDDFTAALELYEVSTKAVGHIMQPFDGTEDETRARNIKRRWRFIAAKDGAMTLYHFGETLDAIRGGLGECKTLRDMVSTEKLKAADKHFDRAFPNYVKLRHSIAHQAMVAKAPYMTVSRSDGSGQTIITGTLIDRRFNSIWNGHRVEYEISESSLSELATIRNQVFDAFTEASDRLKAKSIDTDHTLDELE
jgi:hypothetical protein